MQTRRLTSYLDSLRRSTGMSPVGGAEVKLPQLSIAAKLYAIFALLATVTVALAAVAVVNARHHAALTERIRGRLPRRARMSSASTA